MKWFVDLCLQPGGYWVAVVLLALVGCLTFVTALALVQWRKVRCAECQSLLVQEMLQRGISAEETLQILAKLSPETAKTASDSAARFQETAAYKA